MQIFESICGESPQDFSMKLVSLIGLIGIVVAAQLWSAASSFGQSSPPLKETLGWIQASLRDGHGDIEKQTDKGAEVHTIRLLDFSGCRVHFLITEITAGNESFHDDESFNLGDIDPAKVRFDSHGITSNEPGLFTAATQNAIEKIATKNTYGVTSLPAIKGSVDVFAAEFYSPYGDDFARAFTSAVKTCGGRPSIFTNSNMANAEEKASSGGASASRPGRTRLDVPSIAKTAAGSVVSIMTFDKDASPVAQGSGFLVSRDGLIVTNYHVIAEGASAHVKFPDGAVFVVDGVLASDKTRDVAVIKIHGTIFRTLALGNSDQLQIGEEVVAIGTPLSLESTVSNGIISGRRTSKEQGGEFLQTTAPISPGSSGGPLFNMFGEVIGINTMYLEGGENLNFAIPINDAKRLLLNQSARLQNLPNEALEKELPAEPVPVTPKLEPAQTSSPAYQSYQELLKSGDAAFISSTYACFDEDQQSKTFKVISAMLWDKQKMTVTTQDLTDGVSGSAVSIFDGPLSPISGNHGLFATLHSSYHNKSNPSHETDTFEWGPDVLSIRTGFGTLSLGQTRLSYQFNMQRSTGRYTEQTVFGNGIGPDGFTISTTGRCIRIPNIGQTPEERYTAFLAEKP